MRKALAWAVFAAFFFPAVAVAQVQETAPLVYVKDITDTSYSYCKMKGLNGDPFEPMLGTGRIETSGSSTTVTAETAGDVPFAPVSVGDLLLISYGGTTYRRLVTARASDTSITINAAIDTTGATWSWYKAACGATAADGWIGASSAWAMTFEVAVTTINATSIGYIVECRIGGLAGAQMAASTITTATTAQYSFNSQTAGSWDECRLGLKVNTDTGVQSVSASVSRQDLPPNSQFVLWNPGQIFSKALTESSATSVVQIAVPQTAGANFADATIDWVVFAADATNAQTRSGSTYLGAVNEAGTEACTVSDVGTTVDDTPTGTLTCSTSCVVGLTDVAQFALNCTSDRTQTSLYALARVRTIKTNLVTVVP